MNVNPFSYLIEKLKSKVSKSGDTMTGELKVDTGTSTDSIVSIGGSQNYGALRLKAGTTGKQGTIITSVLTANRNYVLPDKAGTIALTSDILDYTRFNVTAENVSGVSDCVIEVQQNFTKNGIAFLAITLHSVSNTSDIEILLPNNITFKQDGVIGICGKGGRWSVSGVQYIYVGSNRLALNNITANTYYHIIMSLPVNIS